MQEPACPESHSQPRSGEEAQAQLLDGSKGRDSASRAELNSLCWVRENNSDRDNQGVAEDSGAHSLFERPRGTVSYPSTAVTEGKKQPECFLCEGKLTLNRFGIFQVTARFGSFLFLRWKIPKFQKKKKTPTSPLCIWQNVQDKDRWHNWS